MIFSASTFPAASFIAFWLHLLPQPDRRAFGRAGFSRFVCAPLFPGAVSFRLGVITPGFSRCVAISSTLSDDDRADCSCGVRYGVMESPEAFEELRFVSFRGAGSSGGCFDLIGEAVGEVGLSVEVGDSTWAMGSASGSASQVNL